MHIHAHILGEGWQERGEIHLHVQQQQIKHWSEHIVSENTCVSGSFGATVTIVTKGAQETQLWAVEKKCRTYIHKLPGWFAKVFFGIVEKPVSRNH